MTDDARWKRVFAAPARQFTQERSRRTYEALIRASFEVFGELGFDATQTPEIAARAGVSVGTFYRYFTDKREVFLEIMERHLARMHDEVMGGLTPERFIGVERRATIERTLSLLLDNVTRFPALQRVFLEMSVRDRDVGELRQRLDDAARQQLAVLLGVICTPAQVPDPAATAYVIHTAVVECSIHIAGFRGQPPVPRERALAALSQLVSRALFVGEAERGAADAPVIAASAASSPPAPTRPGRRAPAKRRPGGVARRRG
jgi:AcrR family transcriptional regulator